MVSARDPAQDLMLLQMNVDRVLPVVAWVDQDPVLRAVLRNGEPQFVAVGKLIVDYPLAVIAVEDEVPRDARRDDARQLIERRMCRRVNTIVGYRAANSELDTIFAIGVSRSKNVAGWSRAIFLLQTVLQANSGVAADQTLDLVEVNNDVIALRHADAEAGDLYWRGQQVAVIGDDPKRYHCARIVGVGKEELIEPRRPSV